jgi:large repetitive protein
MADMTGIKRLHPNICTTARVAAVLWAASLLSTCDLFNAGLGARVDITPPTLSITSPQQNAYVKGTLTLTGRAADDLGLSSVTVTYSGSSGTMSKSVTVGGGAWSVDIPTGSAASDALADGEQSLSVTATDRSGKITSAGLIAYVDNLPPTVLVTVPQGYAASRPTLNSVFDIKGEVWDRSPVQSVTVQLMDAGGTVLASKLADGTNTWSARFDISDPAFANLGIFRYVVEVLDKAGNPNTYYYHSKDIGVLRDTYAFGTPFPATDEIGRLDQSKTGTTSGFTYAQLHATRLGPETGVYGDFAKDLDGTRPVPTFTNLDPLLPYTSNVLSTRVPISGYVNPGPSDPTGIVTAARAWIIPYSATPTWPGSPNVDPGDVHANPIGRAINFRVDPRVSGSYLGSGHYMIKVEASTDASAISLPLYCEFLVDSGAPRIQAVDPDPAANQYITRGVFVGAPLAGQTGVEFRAQVLDDNAVQSFTVVATVDGVAAGGLATSGPDGSGWYTVRLPVTAGHTDVSFDLTATDNTGTATAPNTVLYSIDETAPTVAIAAPAAGSWVTGNSTTVSGTAADNKTLKTVYVWLGLSTATPPADVTTWNALTGNASWATTLPLGAEGSYLVKAASADQAGNLSAVSTNAFSLDQGNPTLTETGVGPTPVYANTPFSLGGTAADTNGLAGLAITQKKDGGASAPVVPAAPAVSGTSQAWTWGPPAGLTDGTYEFTITLTDVAAKTAPVLSRTVIYDTAKPTIAVTSLTPVIGANTVNGIVTLQAAVADSTALGAVEYRYGDSGGFTPVPGSKTTPTLTIDTTAFTDLATTNVWLRAADLAGNVEQISVPLAVDQASDNPAASLVNMDASRTTPAQAAGNLLESNAKVVGAFSDDDSVDASTLQISIDGGAFGDVDQKTASGKSVSFEHSLGALAEGVHFLSVRASDLASAKSGRPVAQATLANVYFAIDRNPPSLAVTGPAAGGLHNADFLLTGTASDANGLAGSIATIKDGAAVIATPAVAGGTWSCTVLAGVGGLTEGLKNWTVETTDTFGKTTTVAYAFTVDRTPPTVAISAPGAGSWNTGATLTAVGTAADANGVVSVEWSTNGGGTWNAASGTTNWTVLLNLITLGEGTKTLSLRATDAAGNTNAAPVTRSFGVDQTPPGSTETAIGVPSAGRGVLFELTGTATDTNSLQSILIEQKKDAGAWVTVYSDASLSGISQGWTVPAATLPRDPSAPDPSNPASKLLVDGSYQYRITVHDVAGNAAVVDRTVRVDLTPPTAGIGDPAGGAVLVGTAYSVSGTASDGAGSGVSAVYWWAGNFGDTPPADLGSWTAATGTTNWNALLNLSSLGEGHRTLHVKAVDAAANLSAAASASFFIDQAPPSLSVTGPASGAVFSGGFTVSGTAADANLSAVRVTINAGLPAAASGTTSWSFAVAMGDLSVGLNTLSVEALDIAGRTTTQTIDVYRDQAIPVFAFNNLEGDGSSVLLENSPKLVGSVSDSSGVASAESYLESWSYATAGWNAVPVEGWTSLGATSSAKVFNWQKDLGPSGLNLPEGRYRVTLRSSDIAGPSANATSGVPGTAGESVVFRLDRNTPSLTLSSPAQGSFQRTDLSVSGAASDANTVTSVKVKVDSSDMTSGATSASTANGYAAWSAALSSSGLSAGAHTLYVQATDGTGRTTLLSRDFTFDSTAPTLTVITPLSGTSVNGGVSVKGTASDANAVSSVELKIGKDTVWNALPGVYSWEHDFTNVDTYANNTYADEISPGVWRLYIHLRATDAAGNVGPLDTYYLDLDPAMDSPITTIYQPLNNQTVGGSTRVYGISTDDDAVFRVEMQIDLNNDGDFSDQEDYWNYSGTGTPVLTPNGSFDDRFEKESVWYPASGTTNWYQILNAFGEYNAPVQGQTRTIQVRVRAVDTKNGSDAGIPGNFQQISITFDNTVPIVENVQIDPDGVDNGNEISYSTGIRVSGTFYVVATVKDNGNVTEIDRIEQGPLSGTTRIDTDGGITSYQGVIGGYATYKVRFPVNTLTIGGGVFADTSGTYALSLKAVDNTTPNPYQTFSYITVQVDNYYPSGAYTGNTSQVLGTNYKIQGTGTDVGAGSGIVQGVDRVVGYFVKAGQVYNPKLPGPGNHAALGGTLTLKDASTDNTIKSVGYPSSINYLISIDKLTEVGVTDSPPNGDSDGYLESLTVSGNTYDWWAEVNTANLPDGPMDLHYVVFDKAGNGTHYVQTLYVRNNAPVIDSIVLGTDLNGDGTIGNIASGESVQFTSGYGATGFTVRNNRLSITVNASSGNGTMRYSMLYGAAEKNGTLTSSALTITDFSAMADTAVNGAVFSITVYDSTISDDNDATGELTQLGAPLALRLTLDNIDDTPPTIAAAAFGQKYTLPVPNRDSGKVLSAVSDYTENIVMSGPAKLGHVEYAADSQIDGADADVSGKLIIKGKAWDNQRIQRITAAVTGFDPDGAGAATAGSEFTVASWSGSGLGASSSVAPYWAFSLDAASEAVTETDGHVLNWAFAWDTSQMSGGAGYNQTVTLKVYDFGPSGGNTSTSTLTVDVVPYITDIQRGGGVNTNRTRYGRYPVQAGETGLVVNGFNLPSSTTPDASNWVRVYNTGGTANDALTMTATAGTARNSLSLTLPAGTRSGYLRVEVNAIPDANRQNDNTMSYNREDDGSGIASTLWSDDRYLHLWTVNQSFNTSDGAQYPSMSIMGDGTLYGSWIRYDTSLLYYGTTGAAPVTQWGTYDPPEYTDMNVDTSEATLKYALAFAANHYGGSGWGTVPLDAASAGFMGVRTPNSRRLDPTGGRGNTIAYPIESLNLNSQLWQFNRPKVVRSNGGALDSQDRIHTVYYDSRTSAAKYSFTYDDGRGGAKGWLVLDGTTDAQDVLYVSGTGTRTNTTLTDAALIGNTLITAGQTIMLMDGTGNTAYPTVTAFNSGTGAVSFANQFETARTNYTIVTATSNLVTAGVAQSASAGDYLAIDVDEDGLPVVLYYNTAAQTLRLARANKVNPSAPADWTRQDVFPALDTNRQFSGQHVAMKFDATGNLYVVCYRSSTGDLLYLYAPDADGGAAYTFQSSVIVDSAGAVGTWADISLEGGVPHVSYLNSTMIGTFDGIKYATLRPVTSALVGSSTTTSVTSATLVGSTDVAAGQVIVFSDGSSRSVSGFTSGTGQVSWTAPLGAAPGAGTVVRIVSGTDWEYEIAPAYAAVTDQRTSIEVKRGAAAWGDAAVGYRSTRFELMYMKPEP